MKTLIYRTGTLITHIRFLNEEILKNYIREAQEGSGDPDLRTALNHEDILIATGPVIALNRHSLTEYLKYPRSRHTALSDRNVDIKQVAARKWEGTFSNEPKFIFTAPTLRQLKKDMGITGLKM